MTPGSVRAAVTSLARDGHRTVTLADVISRVTPAMSESSVALMMRGLAEGTISPAPGVRVVKSPERGQYELITPPAVPRVTAPPFSTADLAESLRPGVAAFGRLADAIGPLRPASVRAKWYRRGWLGRLRFYIEPRDIWVGVYVARDAVYVCPLPLVVIRYRRRGH
jgi:hypothetical protein